MDGYFVVGAIFFTAIAILLLTLAAWIIGGMCGAWVLT